MNPVEKLALLRAEMKKRHLDAYVVVTDDFHASEYVGAHFKAREFLSGFIRLCRYGSSCCRTPPHCGRMAATFCRPRSS